MLEHDPAPPAAAAAGRPRAGLRRRGCAGGPAGTPTPRIAIASKPTMAGPMNTTYRPAPIFAPITPAVITRRPGPGQRAVQQQRDQDGPPPRGRAGAGWWL